MWNLSALSVPPTGTAPRRVPHYGQQRRPRQRAATDGCQPHSSTIRLTQVDYPVRVRLAGDRYMTTYVKPHTS